MLDVATGAVAQAWLTLNGNEHGMECKAIICVVIAHLSMMALNDLVELVQAGSGLSNHVPGTPARRIDMVINK